MSHQGYSLRLRSPLLILLMGIVSGCGPTSPKPPELGTGLVFAGGGNDIALGGFWFNLEGNGVPPEERTVPEIDPMGGYLFLYWIDDQGNVCHGQPGQSGQPGAVYVTAFQRQAYDLANQGSTITGTQLVDFQKIPYRTSSYTSGTPVSGLHFAQFGNVIWRSRDDGAAFLIKSSVVFSVPLILSVETTNTLFPYSPDKQATCSSQAVPLPQFPPGGPAQDPNICGTRTVPSADSMNYQNSLNYCLVNLPHGMEWQYLP